MRGTAAVLVMAGWPLAGATAPPDWHEFDYAVSAAIGPGDERVALLLRAQIDGRKCWLQLDTGAPDAVLWHGPASDAKAPATAVQVRIGDLEKTVQAPAAVLAQVRQGECAVGSVGNGFFEHGTLALDFPGSRYAFVPGATLGSDRMAQPMRYLRGPAGGGYPLLPALLFDGTPGHLLFDTGSARFGVVAPTLAQWTVLSGGRALADTAAVRSYAVSNAMDAAPLRCHDTTVGGTIALAGQRLAPGIVSYCEGKELRLAVPLAGVLGLRALAGHRITLDYVSQRWKLEKAD
ncbi:hypothetical protein [Pseudoduganella chitinolytica]|uniref:Aspartyl protease n=1 Tax=Pseudoduganella chitinolytica TaxID=34070 RepID=A0ABY8B6Y6_9BURK|nr:hypothetical protein [Pseudoduganella chitinolytica]WEF30783.1 hypothetical protein PX653_15000 [Pseudoduganella chitinolytica]